MFYRPHLFAKCSFEGGTEMQLLEIVGFWEPRNNVGAHQGFSDLHTKAFLGSFPAWAEKGCNLVSWA
jgi:hypothetical protein